MPTYLSNESRVPCGVAVLIPTWPKWAKQIHYFMIQRHGSHGALKWSVPGGWVESGESPDEAAKREAWEEVGITITKLGFLTYTHDMHEEGVEDICLWFRAYEWKGEPKNTNPDRILKTEWWEKGLILNSKEKLFLPLLNYVQMGGEL